MSTENEIKMNNNKGMRSNKMTQNRKFHIFVACFLLLAMLPLATILAEASTPTSLEIGANDDANNVGLKDIPNQKLLGAQNFDQDALETLNAANIASLDDERTVEGEPKLPETLDIGKLFKDNLAGYQKVWEPWLSKAAIHDIEVSENGDFLLVGGGYLYDNEVHVYRWNDVIGKYVRVWESGDSLIKGDVFSISMGDTDNNQFIEVAAASSDGRVYVFEQTHIYDPFTRTETRFDPVWVSPDLTQAWGVKIDDTDRDYLTDIIVGSWDGYVRWYEYRDHSGYPFSKEHWIEYREVFRYPIDGLIQSLTTTDLNGNGLPEVIVGTRDGTIYVLENNGTVIDVEGQPFPLTRDNNYQLIWKNNESLWYPIMKMATGQLDEDRDQEVVVTARGQGVYVLDFEPEADDFVLSKLTIPLESWETPSTGAGYPLDHFVDWMINSSGNVYGWDGRLEPDDYVNPPGSAGFSPTIFPYNTALAQAPDNNYTLFDASASGTVASATLDFGNDEELTGDGRPGVPSSQRGYDLYVSFDPTTPPIPSRMTFYVSNDGEIWEEVPSDDLLVVNSTMLFVDVDAALSARQWSGAQFLNITVHSNGFFRIDAITSRLLNRPIDTATSAIVGKIQQTWNDPSEPNKVIVGTVDGKILVYRYDNALGIVEKVFDSYGDERYTLGGNIWDLVQLPSDRRSTTPIFKAVGNPFKNYLNTFEAGGAARSVSWAKLHQLSDVNPALPGYIDQKDVVVTASGKAYILRGDDFSYSPTLTTRYFANINALPASEMSVAFSTKSTANLFGIPQVAAVAVNTFGSYYDPFNPSVTASVQVALYKITDPNSAYVPWQPLVNLEVTGYLKSILPKSQVLPTMAFGDMDGDGFEDLIIANGKLHLIKSNGLMYQLDDDYFADINMKSSRIFTNPQIVDFDGDGDFDLVLSYDDRPGIAYWINIGTSTEPRWEFRRQDLINLKAETNLAFNNFTLFSVQHGDYLNETKSILAYQNHTTGLAVFEADFETHDSFIVGINPKLSRIDINIREGSDSDGTIIQNFGYRILETWNTEGELKEWTQSIAIADMDDDGKREVIAGDFDNNIYVFEHLSNNTYKRAFRSNDLAQRINTTQSPYAHEQLFGISASFIRFEWQHVNLLVAGVDTDRDGRQEFIATAGLTIYVFEYNGRDDHYQLSWVTDLGETVWKSVFDYLGITEFTALRASKDMNYNGYGEFLVAAGPFLFIFESYGNNKYREIFMDSSLKLFLPGSHYFMPENGLLNYFATYDGSSKLIIRDVAVGNIIKDTPEQEIVIVGEIQKIWGEEHGFLYIMKNVGSTFYHEAEASDELTKFNPIYTVELDDQDYDGNIDIIVGHKHGIDIYEAKLRANPAPTQSSYELQRQAILSGSPNYPYISPLYAMNNLSKGITIPPNIKNNELLLNFIKDFGVIFAKDRIDTRSTEILALHTSLGLPGTSGYLPAGAFIQVFTKNGRLHWAVSLDKGATWKQEGQLFTGSDYRSGNSPIIGQEDILLGEFEPALYQAPTGQIFLSWSLLFYNQNLGKTFTAIMLSSKSVLSDGSVSDWKWTFMKVISESTSIGSFLTHPSVFQLPTNPNSVFAVGISFMNVFNSTVFFAKRFLIFGGFTTILNVVPFIGTSSNSTFKAVSIDAIYQASGPGNGTYLLAFSGEKYSEAKGDLDIWVTTANETFEWTSPVRVSNAPTTDAYPDLTQLRSSDGSVMVVWELQDREAQGEIGVSYSKTGGRTWREPETLASIPEFMEFKYFPILGISLPVWRIFPAVVFGNFLISSPTITALPNGGFTYSYVASYDTFLLQVVPVSDKYLKTSAVNFAQSSQGVVKLVPLTPPSAFYDFYNSKPTTQTVGTQQVTDVSYSQTSLGYRSLSTISEGLKSTSEGVQARSQGTNLAILGQVSVEQVLSFQSDAVSQAPTSSLSTAVQRNNLPSTKNYVDSNYAVAYDKPSKQSSRIPSRVAGTYRNIFTGRNFDDFWLRFDFFEASNIAVGDSDGDGRREIALTSRNQAFLVELARNSPDGKFYRQAWNSGDLGITLTDIQLYDGNGNGFEEVLVSGEFGNIYAFEIDNLNLEHATIQFLVNEKKDNLNWNQSLATTNHEIIAAFDANGDGLDELVISDLTSTTPLLRLYLNGDPSTALTLSVTGVVTRTTTLDINNDGIIDLLAYGTDAGEFAIINLTQSILVSSLTKMHPQGSMTSSIRGIDFLFNNNSATNWSLLVVSRNEIILQDLGSSTPSWNRLSSSLTGFNLVGSTIGIFKTNDSSMDASIAVVDNHANIIFLESNSGIVTMTFTFLNNSNVRKLLFTADDLNDDGIDDIIVALDGKQLVAIDTFDANITWSIADFREGETFQKLYVRDLNQSGEPDTYLISDSSFSDAIELTTRTSFENYFNSTVPTPGTPVSSIPIPNVDQIIGSAIYADPSFLTNTTLCHGISSCRVYPTHGNFVLMGPQGASPGNSDFGFVFKNPISRISFRITYNTSADIAISLFNESLTGPIHIFNLSSNSIAGTKLEFKAGDFGIRGFGAVKIVPQVIGFTNTWYIDELEYDVLQPRVFLRSFSADGSLNWEYSAGAQRVNAFQINDNPEGLVSPVGLIGLSVNDDNVTSQYDVRGLLAIDLKAGHPTFYGGIQANTMTGITGRMEESSSSKPIDGTFFLANGSVFAFQFLDVLSTETLTNVSITKRGDWGYKLSSPVEFVKATDVNSDGTKDIVAVTLDGYVYALDGSDENNVIWKTRLNPNPTEVVIGDFVNQNGIDDVFISFKDGTIVTVNGSSGLVAWTSVLIFSEPVSALNVGDRNGDGFDEIALGTKIIFAATSFGRVMLLNGRGDGTGGMDVLSSKPTLGPIVKMQLADSSASTTNDYLIALSRAGFLPFTLYGFAITGSSISYAFVDSSFEFMDFDVVRFSSAADGLAAVTLTSELVYYFNINDVSTIGPGFVFDLATVTTQPVSLPHIVESHDRDNNGMDDTVTLGLLGFGFLSLDVLNGQVLWTFRDASIRTLVRRNTPFIDYYPDSLETMPGFLVTNAEIAYILSGNTGSLRWMTSLPFISGDITSIFIDSFTSGENNSVVVGTDRGYILRFNLTNSETSASLSVFTPWFDRYRNVPLSPSPSLSYQHESIDDAMEGELPTNSTTTTSQVLTHDDKPDLAQLSEQHLVLSPSPSTTRPLGKIPTATIATDVKTSKKTLRIPSSLLFSPKAATNIQKEYMIEGFREQTWNFDNIKIYTHRLVIF